MPTKARAQRAVARADRRARQFGHRLRHQLLQQRQRLRTSSTWRGILASGNGVNPNPGRERRRGASSAASTLGFLANFLQTNADGNILSTPNLLTLDNRRSQDHHRQRNIPIPTGSFATPAAREAPSIRVHHGRTQDVSLTLRAPQISGNGTVKMVIYQEVSSISPESLVSRTARSQTSAPSQPACWSKTAASWCWAA